MGYSHGTKWTDEIIKEKVLEMVRELELNRMPSRSECVKYYQNDALANAISKKIGWYELANQLSLSIKESETYFGKKFEKIAQDELISRGYEVRKMPQNFPYDLLVNDCIKIDVKCSQMYCGKNGNFYSFNLEKPFCTCDIYILYLVHDDEKVKDVLVIPSPVVAIKTQISVGQTASKYYRYSQRWKYIREYADFLTKIS